MTFALQDNDLHRARKAVITPFFSRRAVAEKQFLLHEKAHDLCEVIREDAAAGRATSMENLFGAYSLHIICEMVMGLSENVLRDREKATMWRNTLGSIFEVIPVALNFPFIMAAMQSLPASAVEKMNPYFGFLNKFYTVRGSLSRCLSNRKLSMACISAQTFLGRPTAGHRSYALPRNELFAQFFDAATRRKGVLRGRHGRRELSSSGAW